MPNHATLMLTNDSADWYHILLLSPFPVKSASCSRAKLIMNTYKHHTLTSRTMLLGHRVHTAATALTLIDFAINAVKEKRITKFLALHKEIIHT